MSNTHPEVERYSDVPLVFEAELDRRPMSIRDLLGLQVGRTLKLSRAVGEELPLYVSGALIGRGEVIRLNHCMGVRISALESES